MIAAARFALVALLCLGAGLGQAQQQDLPELGDPTVAIISAEQEYRLGRGWLRRPCWRPWTRTPSPPEIRRRC